MKKTEMAIGIAGLISVSLLLPEAGNAQQEDDDFALEEILVTARKREESLQEIPVSITTFGREAIQAADLRALDDVSNLTPGFQFKNQGNQQPGRYNTQLQFRGLTTAQFSPSFATGALFIDGIYVLNGGTSLSLNDVERIEVIKGPQSAYFGRNTFGGAVNLITRDPNMESFGGEVALATTDRSNNDLSVFVEGPIVQDSLSFSLSGRLYDKRGHFVANDGGRTGNEETTALNGVLKWQATDALSFKLRYGYSEDDDGAPAQGFVSGIVNDSCTGRTINTADGPANPVRYICGQVDGPKRVATLNNGSVISSNTFLPQNVIDAGLTDPSTLIADVPQVDEIGLLRETERLSLFASYDINDYSIDFAAGMNEQRANWIRDFDLSDRVQWFSRDPQYMEDESYELRITSPQDGRFRWSAGVNAYEQEFTTSGGGGDATTSCFVPGAQPLTDDSSLCIPGLVLLFPNSQQNNDEADVFGVFAAVDFDLTDEITLIVEGRYQEDEITKGAGLTTPGAPLLTESFDKFLPRVIARWQPNDATNLYASYSLGHIAGDFNTFVINADAQELAQYAAVGLDIPNTGPEELDAIELGWKQTFADGRGQMNVSVYRYEWTGIKGRSSVLINETCRAGDIGATGCDPALGIAVGDTKQVDDGMGNLTPFFNSRNVNAPGDATMSGAEVELRLRPTENLDLAANVSYISSEYDDYVFNFVAPFAGFSQMRGNQTPRQPEWSGNASATYFFDVRNYDGYVRADALYQGETFVDESNLAFIEDYTVFNLRAGLGSDRYGVELFVRNLFDEQAWATGARWTDFSSPTQFVFLTAKQGVAVTPLDRREFGLRLNFNFGN